MTKKRKYVRRPMTDDRIITKVQAIRRKNNIAWMNILRLAFKARPKQARKIMDEINKNDVLVTKWMSRLGGKK